MKTRTGKTNRPDTSPAVTFGRRESDRRKTKDTAATEEYSPGLLRHSIDSYSVLPPNQAAGAAQRTEGEPEDVQEEEQEELRSKPKIQSKLIVGPADDKYEREADRMADTVMAMPDDIAPRANEPSVLRSGADVSEEEELQEKPDLVRREPLPDEEDESLQAKSDPSATPAVDHATERLIGDMRGSGGRPLPDSERAFFEPRFGRDFGDVRLHTDSRAQEAARSVKAKAFTLGKDIAFGPGEYAPGTSEGRHLLAHELTHTVQQGAAPGSHDVQRVAVAAVAIPAAMIGLFGIALIWSVPQWREAVLKDFNGHIAGGLSEQVAIQKTNWFILTEIFNYSHFLARITLLQLTAGGVLTVSQSIRRIDEEADQARPGIWGGRKPSERYPDLVRLIAELMTLIATGKRPGGGDPDPARGERILFLIATIREMLRNLQRNPHASRAEVKWLSEFFNKVARGAQNYFSSP